MDADVLAVVRGLAIPFVGTALGALCVLFMRRALDLRVQRALTGFAAGVMVAASVWSLIIPAIEQAVPQAGSGAGAALGAGDSAGTGLAALASLAPVLAGFWAGVLFLLLLDHAVPHLHPNETQPEGPRTAWHRTTKLVFAVALHNVPEGMAVGVVYAGLLSGTAHITDLGALALSVGIAVQNFPEGAIVSMPLRAAGMGRARACWAGVLSGAVEPLGAAAAIALAGLVVPAMPFLLSFAAGAMLYVVVEELVPEMAQGPHSNVGPLMFAVGFSLMMALDVALG